MTLNLLRPARCNSRLSAYAYLSGEHNYNKVPLAPPGTKVIMHRTPSHRKTWDFQGQLDWYVGPAPEHSRCYRCYIPSTGKEVITDTVKFLLAKVPFPHESFRERFLRIFNKLTKLLHHSSNEPLNSVLRRSYDIEKALKFIAEVVGNNLVPGANQKSAISTSPKNIAQIPRVVPSTTDQRMIVPPGELRNLTSVGLENTTSRAPEKTKTLRPTTPSLPIMPTFRELFHKRLNQKIQHIFYPKGNKMSIDNLISDPIMARVWQPALDNELSRLSQGFKKRVNTQDAMDFIAYSDIPKDRKVTYANFICDYRPLKTERFRVRMTI